MIEINAEKRFAGIGLTTAGWLVVIVVGVFMSGFLVGFFW